MSGSNSFMELSLWTSPRVCPFIWPPVYISIWRWPSESMSGYMLMDPFPRPTDGRLCGIHLPRQIRPQTISINHAFTHCKNMEQPTGQQVLNSMLVIGNEAEHAGLLWWDSLLWTNEGRRRLVSASRQPRELKWQTLLRVQSRAMSHDLQLQVTCRTCRCSIVIQKHCFMQVSMFQVSVCFVIAVANFLLVGVHTQDIFIPGVNLTQEVDEADPDITSLVVYSLSQEHLNDGIFSKLTNLKKLKFKMYSKVEVISSGVLAGLISLRRLELIRCSIHKIEDFAFEDLKELRKLNIRFNSIDTITNYTFNGLVSLRELFLSENPIIQLDTGAFSELQNLKRLMMVGNSTTELKREWFQNLRFLKELEFASFLLTHIPEGVFSSQILLQNLRITRGATALIKQHMWTGLSSLKNLRLRHDGISTIQACGLVFLL